MLTYHFHAVVCSRYYQTIPFPIIHIYNLRPKIIFNLEVKNCISILKSCVYFYFRKYWLLIVNMFVNVNVIWMEIQFLKLMILSKDLKIWFAWHWKVAKFCTYLILFFKTEYIHNNAIFQGIVILSVCWLWLQGWIN